MATTDVLAAIRGMTDPWKRARDAHALTDETDQAVTSLVAERNAYFHAGLDRYRPEFRDTIPCPGPDDDGCPHEAHVRSGLCRACDGVWRRRVAAAEAAGEEPPAKPVGQRGWYGWKTAVLEATGLTGSAGGGLFQKMTSGPAPDDLPDVPQLPNEAAYWAKVRELNEEVRATQRLAQSARAIRDAAIMEIIPVETSDTVIAQRIGMRLPQPIHYLRRGKRPPAAPPDDTDE